MSATFIDRLPIPSSAKKLLSELGVSNPEALLGLIGSSPNELGHILGPETMKSLTEALKQLVDQETAVRLLEPEPEERGFGARLDVVSERTIKSFDPRERDLLYERLIELQKKQDPSTEELAEVEFLQRKIEELMTANKD